MPTPAITTTQFSSSTFTLTFAIEILNIDVFHDCDEGWIDLDPCTMGMKIQYQLYFGHSYDIDVMIWPHVAKVWCGTEAGWVRTFLYLERRWMAFSIRHAFPVRVMDMRPFEAVVTPVVGVEYFGSAARSDKPLEVYIPKLEFGERRYFGRVVPYIESEKEGLVNFIRKLIWNAVQEYIPASFMDGTFDIPYPVTDIRHQDAAFQYIQETTFYRKPGDDAKNPDTRKVPLPSIRREKSEANAKGKKNEKIENKFYLQLTGHDILAGAGRVIPFRSLGQQPANMGEVAVFISSGNLPSVDDVPILFINVERLIDAPINDFKKYKIEQLYTKWKITQNEQHASELVDVLHDESHPGVLKFNDHYAIPLDPDYATETTAIFLDDAYEIELWGKRLPQQTCDIPTFFGLAKGDKDFKNKKVTKNFKDEDILETLIAVTRIDAKLLAKGIQAFIREEYPLFPPRCEVMFSEREPICTNDINAIGAPLQPTIIFPPNLVLESQMSLEVSMGVVGCKPPRLTAFFSRLYCLVSHSAAIMAILMKIKDINETECKTKCDLLTGFAIDTGEIVVLFLEGAKDGKVLHVWEQTADFYPNVKPIFSSSARYSRRVYPELVNAAIPFIVMKMFVPLTATLACPPIYARPVFPLPTRAATLKLGRLIGYHVRVMPGRRDLPSFNELQSFKLELCVPTRPPPPAAYRDTANVNKELEDARKESIIEAQKDSTSSPARIYWSPKASASPLNK